MLQSMCARLLRLPAAGVAHYLVLATAVLIFGGSAHARPQTGDRDALQSVGAESLPQRDLRTRMTFGPVAGFTTVEHEALEGGLVVPIGASIDFALEDVPDGETVAWTGDGMLATRGAAATFNFGRQGPVHIFAECRPSGRVFDCMVYPQVISPASLRFNAEILEEGPLDLHEDMSNMETMEYFFLGRSVGRLHGNAREGYVVSDGVPIVGAVQLLKPAEHGGRSALNRRLNRGASIPASAMESLLEWRVDGRAIGVGQVRLSHLESGARTVSIGPPSKARDIDLTVFDTKITSHGMKGPIDVGTPVTFAATTEPPGFEQYVRWLASTKFGSVEPTLGVGESFTTQFTDAYGTTGNTPHMWIGVAANLARVGADGKPDLLALLQGSREEIAKTITQLLRLRDQSDETQPGWLELTNAIAAAFDLQDKLDAAIAAALEMSAAEVAAVKELLKFILPHWNNLLDDWRDFNERLKNSIDGIGPDAVGDMLDEIGITVDNIGMLMDAAGTAIQNSIPVIGDTVGLALKTAGAVGSTFGQAIRSLAGVLF